MGNQLAGIAPSQILSVDNYLTDVTDYEYDCSLGSTRFFKVARAKYKEGLSVVKVFAIQDPSLPIKPHKDKVEDIKVKLSNASNCLPYQRSTLSDKAALLFRQSVRSNLYDRISTRPFLNSIEKKWIAFQLLCALNQSHKVKNNPSDYNFFFDTSRRRTCYIAPERFIDVSSKQQMSELEKGMPQELESLPDSENILGSYGKGELTPAMDVFSAGCVIAELFTEGHPPFHLSTLLAYRNDVYTPDKIINKIEDPYIKALVEHMIQKDPNKRETAEEYLRQFRGTAFPEYFYSFLKAYMGDFASLPILPSDEKIARVHKDIRRIIDNLCPKDEKGVNSIEHNGGLVIAISLITSCLRSLKFCIAKLAALDLMFILAKHVPAEVVLDRLIPYMIYLVNDPFPRVRAQALKILTQSLALVKNVPRSDANIFPEYILPNLGNLTQDAVVAVRVAYAENIASLAETALRFLEITQLDHTTPDEESDSILDPSVQYQGSYDAELQDLHEMIQQRVVTLLCDPENIVKQTLLENGITRLCVFFGRQKANDVLLSHMITFLNDKDDWHLRGSFFDSIVGVAAYVGWQSSSILKPLLQQGLNDTEEAVICKTLHALTCLIELNLLQKTTILELFQEVVVFLSHPNSWMRHDAVGFIAAIARSFSIADVHCNILPTLNRFIKQPIIQVDQEVILLSVLNDPVPRPVYDYILKSPIIENLFDTLQDRQLIRNITRQNHEPNYNPIDDSNLSQLFRKLHSQGMSVTDEDKLLELKEHMIKVHRGKSNNSVSDSRTPDEEVPIQPGIINIQSLKVTRRHADMKPAKDSKADNQNQSSTKKSGKKKANIENVMVNEEWKSMFGATDVGKSIQPALKPSPTQPPTPEVQLGQTHPLSQTQQQEGMQGQATQILSPDGPISMSQLQANESGSPKKKASDTKVDSKTMMAQPQARFAGCKLELRKLVHKKRDQYLNDTATKMLIEDAIFESKPPPPGWKPKGLLVAHLHEHKAAVNRISISHDHTLFASCSNDGTVKIWDCQRLEGKSVANRSRQTYNRQTGQIKTATFFKSSYTIASASDDGSIHVFRIDPSTPRIGLLNQKISDPEEDGIVVDMHHMETGSQSILAYATVYGSLIGWDLRAPSVAWKLKNEQRHGLITSFVVDHKQCWLGVGTSSGTHVCWDMRFQLPITTLTHPAGARVRQLLMHPMHQSWVISAVQGNNEVSMWDMETGARQMTLWASTTPPLSQSQQASNHAVNAMYCSPADGSPLLLTAGSDMRIRYWDLAYPQSSYVITGGANDHLHQTAISYKHKLVDGTEVIQETYAKQRVSSSSEDPPRRGPDPVPVGHRDSITDIAVFQTTQGFIASCSRDGVIKIWK
ncbi:phosphoinositide 3-kinase regulatory subunit 4-like isoform X2 [Ptychodera flava]|uniref:phosphoinositide 3-kinase regulatory subunit 4-like isoform X2 n=1 Tax=Ptychodera flava TaxID=63121 RepID=UPI00396A774B